MKVSDLRNFSFEKGLFLVGELGRLSHQVYFCTFLDREEFHKSVVAVLPLPLGPPFLLLC